MIVDSGREEMADPIMAEIRKIAGDKPVRYLANTSWYPDHTGGNAKLSEGTKVPVPQRAAIISHENTLAKLSEIGKTGDHLPTDTFFGASKQIRFNDEPIDILYEPNAHTDGDVLVNFRKSDVLCVGDIINANSYPIIKPEEGGGINGEIDALNRILDITVPDWREEGGTNVIPGHGHIYNEADVADYRDMLTIIRDRIQDAIKKGKTLEQVKAERLTRDYDTYYGSTTGEWTTDMFVTAVYNSLKK
jgi:cyclase